MKHPEQANSYKCKDELCLLGAGTSGKWLWLKVSVKGNENIQESDSGHDCTTLWYRLIVYFKWMCELYLS